MKDLDIFAQVGRAVAHDEIIPFKVKNKKLIVNGKKSDIEGSTISLTLVKVRTSNGMMFIKEIMLLRKRSVAFYYLILNC